MKLDNIAISALRAKLDNSKMSKLPWRVVSDVTDGTMFHAISTADGGHVAWAQTDNVGTEFVNFDEDHAELAVAAVNALPTLLDYIEALHTAMVTLRDEILHRAKRQDPYAPVVTEHGVMPYVPLSAGEIAARLDALLRLSEAA